MASTRRGRRSNIATEGRSTPSLKQLDEAVRAFLEEHPHDKLTVVVDATFGHRIDPSEKAAFDEAIANNEMVTPPAGAIGRGDAFVLEIADRANALVLSNDSFQEFHGTHTWLFDEGRLIGGKPVPDVGWVFVSRTPVRGATSQRAVRDARKRKSGASEPAEAPAGRSSSRGGSGRSRAAEDSAETTSGSGGARRSRGDAGEGARRRVSGCSPPSRRLRRRRRVKQAAGTKTGDRSRQARARRRCAGQSAPASTRRTTRSLSSSSWPTSRSAAPCPARSRQFSSHGAYVLGGGAVLRRPQGPRRPRPRSARDVLERGEVRDFVVLSRHPRRGIDLILPGLPPRPAGAREATPRPPPPAVPPPRRPPRAHPAPAPRPSEASGVATACRTPAARQEEGRHRRGRQEAHRPQEVGGATPATERVLSPVRFPGPPPRPEPAAAPGPSGPAPPAPSPSRSAVEAVVGDRSR